MNGGKMDESRCNNPEYSIVVCNLNMAETLEESLNSILSQVDHNYEVVVVDGGSTDGSLEILQDLSRRDDRVRTVLTESLDQSSLGADRNAGVRKARGDHVLVQLDADDKFEPIIEDFIDIYEQLRVACDQDFYLSGHGINVAPKEFLLSYGPYRSGIDRGEDADMWRRMLADDAMIQLDHERVCRSLGYDPDTQELIQQRFSELTGDFQSGVTFISRLRQAFSNTSYKMMGLELVLAPLAYVNAHRHKRYSVPEPFTDANVLDERLAEIERTVNELAADCDSFDLEDLSLTARGKEIFFVSQ
jgi:glycosyltransferase involved in cell wall biosynthesis